MKATWVPDFLHLNRSVISAFRKHVKLNKLTIHEPGHSSRGSGGGVVVGGSVGLVTCGRGFWVDAIRLLSQHTDPLLQFDVLGIKIDGRSQNAAMIFRRQNPGHLGRGAYEWVFVWFEEDWLVLTSKETHWCSRSYCCCCLDFILIAFVQTTFIVSGTKSLFINVITK